MARWRYYTLRMSTGLIWQTVSTSSDDTSQLGELLGSNLTGGAVVNLVADLGGGKTTFTQGLAKGLDSSDAVSSPTFTLSRIYKAKNSIEVHHYDFYRLDAPGVLADQLAESLDNTRAVTVVEWSGIVEDVLPAERISVQLKPTAASPDEREVIFEYSNKYTKAIKQVQTAWEQTRP